MIPHHPTENSKTEEKTFSNEAVNKLKSLYQYNFQHEIRFVIILFVAKKADKKALEKQFNEEHIHNFQKTISVAQ